MKTGSSLKVRLVIFNLMRGLVIIGNCAVTLLSGNFPGELAKAAATAQGGCSAQGAWSRGCGASSWHLQRGLLQPGLPTGRPRFSPIAVPSFTAHQLEFVSQKNSRVTPQQGPVSGPVSSLVAGGSPGGGWATVETAVTQVTAQEHSDIESYCPF